MKWIIFGVLYIGGTLQAFSQIAFQKTYNVSTFNNYGSCVKQTFDGGYIVTSFESTYSAGDEDVYLLKTDAQGAVLWSRTFGGTNTDNGFHALQTADSGYIVTGFTWSFGSGMQDIYVIKTKSDGDTLWTKTYGGTNNDVANSIKQTQDGGYIIAGHTDISLSNTDSYLIKIDSGGQMLWSKKFGGTDYDDGFYADEIGNGDIIMVGSIGWSDISLVKTNSAGNVLWAKAYGSSIPEFGYSLQQTDDSGFIILGDTYANSGNIDMQLVKVDSDGNFEWAKMYGGATNEFSGSVKQTEDGGYIIIGSTQSFGGGYYDVYMIRTNSSGDTLLTKTFGGANWDIAGYDCIQQTSDKGFIVSAISHSFSSGGSSELYLIKTDSLGNSGCNEFPAYGTVSIPPTLVSSSVISGSAFGIQHNTKTIVGSGGVATTLCLQLGINESNHNENAIEIFPNPSSDYIFVNYEPKTKHPRFEILDVMGRTVLVPKEGQSKIDISSLPQGLYLLKVSDGDLYFAKRFVKN